MKLFLLLLLGLPLGVCQAQTTTGPTASIDPKSVRTWVVKSAREYAGVYQFGESEAESRFIVCVEQGLITAQNVSSNWNGKQLIGEYRTFRNVRIAGNKLTADQLQAEFVTYTNAQGSRMVGLRVQQPWSGLVKQGQWVFGHRSSTLESYYNSPFGFISYRLLAPAELKGRSLAELALMRNELFATYGFIFAKGGAMDRHFRSLEWYTPQHRDVSGFLNDIERRNLDLIRRQEAAR